MHVEEVPNFQWSVGEGTKGAPEYQDLDYGQESQAQHLYPFDHYPP